MRKCSSVLMMICFIMVTLTFLCFSQPSLNRNGQKVQARTHIGRSLPVSPLLDTHIVEVKVNPDLHLVEYVAGKTITLQTDGAKESFITTSDTVAALLEEQKLTLNTYDEIQPALDQSLRHHDFIRICRVQYKDYSEIAQIPYQVIHQDNPHVYKGLKVLWQPGEYGKKRKYHRDRMEDGKLVSSTLLKEEIISPPTNEIIAHGTLDFRGNYVKKLRMLASSYNPTVEQCGPNPFVTYSGLRVRYGIVATDPKVIPLGTWLYVSGYGYALAADIGGAIKGNRIDCFFWTSHVGSGWRGGYIDVYILDKEP